MYPKDLKYTEKHEWVRVEGNEATVGITYFAQDQLGAIVGVGLPDEGIDVEKGSELADLDSMKTADQIFAPISGRIVRVNTALDAQPELLNDDPYGDGWVVVIEMSDVSELDDLMSAEEYEAHVAKEAGE
ncbi:MAG: glycine cleavage system protein GcvH [Bacillota bacterium]|jgi:glycine cleavage system H protein|nr:glycine cleavage system protein GcvH [Bacillota bacterium]MDI9414719.1 glycine cleavage system protein GcvH [Bacillota bacterium]NLD13306.1 glycine cleavage system protein GcvH [Bacillota bacterium]HOB88637.1 glycine cleavage system protein GcvH [Bacillota bacterium]HOJ57296.1 glycine cleavage system protein GcvH [Bacillota bacterium]